MNKRGPIVLIDDDGDDLHLLIEIFSDFSLPNEIHLFKNPLSAVAFLQRPDIDPFLIISDINMPVMNGWSFLEQISHKFSERNLHVIIVSSSIQVTDRNKAQTFNHVVDYLEKPMKPADMAQVKEVLNSWLYDENADRVLTPVSVKN